MLSRLFKLDMKNTLDNKKSQNNRQVKRKERKKRVNKNRSSIQKKHTLGQTHTTLQNKKLLYSCIIERQGTPKRKSTHFVPNLYITFFVYINTKGEFLKNILSIIFHMINIKENGTVKIRTDKKHHTNT